ncbi:uncharacterized protein CCOS01_04631 [Colletotrichum costaricense]|uniref:Uncharacterized protein n=1 Tax=Colletotrichum costaricense TaxID=1209916 RepID=A0AAI9Z4C5_9PEZI|nr:uncharacterized protein CCOS01_04631 [Colletotrichum costaricense]KAK1532648.1 hypothetical protein CCOS01_04631 [Colletotrichum costaricense]
MRIGRCLFPIQCLIIIAIVLVVGSGGGKAASFTAFSPTEGGVPSARSWMNSDNATTRRPSISLHCRPPPGFGRSRSFAGTARQHGGLFYAEETEFPPMQSGARDRCCTCRAALNSKSRDVWGMAIGKTTMDQTNHIPCGSSPPTTQDGPGAYEASERVPELRWEGNNIICRQQTGRNAAVRRARLALSVRHAHGGQWERVPIAESDHNRTDPEAPFCTTGFVRLARCLTKTPPAWSRHDGRCWAALRRAGRFSCTMR